MEAFVEILAEHKHAVRIVDADGEEVDGVFAFREQRESGAVIVVPISIEVHHELATDKHPGRPHEWTDATNPSVQDGWVCLVNGCGRIASTREKNEMEAG